MEAGDCSPSTPIGINLPNADWIRAEYGSKSVTISNIIDAYDEASKGNGSIDAEMELFSQQAKEVDIIITTAQIPGRDWCWSSWISSHRNSQ